MRNRVSVLGIMVFLLLLLFSVPTYAAPGPDGFANIPWGASSSQVDEAMKAQGFSVDSQFTFGGTKAYRGKLDGTSGRLEFHFERDTFYEGVFVHFAELGVLAAKARGGVFKEKIEAKYGPAKPGESSYARGPALIWEGLQAPGTLDMVRIDLIVNLNTYPNPVIVLVYKNEGLYQRLLAQEKNGL